jgi:hypothetical protein
MGNYNCLVIYELHIMQLLKYRLLYSQNIELHICFVIFVMILILVISQELFKYISNSKLSLFALPHTF